MPAVLPILAGSLGSALIGKLIDVLSEAGTTAPIDESSTVSGAGRVYDQGEQVQAPANTDRTIVIPSPNAIPGQEPQQVANAAPVNAPAASAPVPQASAQQRGPSAGLDPAASAQLKADVAADMAEGGNAAAVANPVAPVADTESSAIDGNDLLNSLLAAAGGGAAVYGASKLANNGSTRSGARVEPTMDAAPQTGGHQTASGIPIDISPVQKAPNQSIVDQLRNALSPAPARSSMSMAIPPAASNVVDAEWSPVNDPMNLSAGDKTLALNAPQKALPAPDAALPKPGEKPAIAMPDETSGPTVKQGPAFDPQQPSNKLNIAGRNVTFQNGLAYDTASGAYLGDASKVIPRNQQGLARTLGILKRVR